MSAEMSAWTPERAAREITLPQVVALYLERPPAPDADDPFPRTPGERVVGAAEVAEILRRRKERRERGEAAANP